MEGCFLCLNQPFYTQNGGFKQQPVPGVACSFRGILLDAAIIGFDSDEIYLRRQWFFLRMRPCPLDFGGKKFCPGYVQGRILAGGEGCQSIKKFEIYAPFHRVLQVVMRTVVVSGGLKQIVALPRPDQKFLCH